MNISITGFNTETEVAIRSMVSKKIGKLFYDTYTERMDIRFEDGSYYGGLHCGNTFEYLKDHSWTNPEWLPTRLEFDHSADDFYLVGLYAPGKIPIDHAVRI